MPDVADVRFNTRRSSLNEYPTNAAGDSVSPGSADGPPPPPRAGPRPRLAGGVVRAVFVRLEGVLPGVLGVLVRRQLWCWLRCW